MRPVVLLPLLCSLSAVAGYYFSKNLDDELRVGKKWVLVISALASLASLAVLPWWQVSVIAGTVLVGWLPAILGAGWLSTNGTLVAAQIAILLAFTTGTRWRADNFKPAPLLIAAAIIAGIGAALI